MPPQTLLFLFVHGVSRSDFDWAITNQKSIVSGRKVVWGNIHQDGDPGVIKIREGLATIEDCWDNSSSQVTSQVGGDGIASKSQDRIRIGHSDNEWSASKRNEGICRIQSCPDDDSLYGG